MGRYTSVLTLQAAVPLPHQRAFLRGRSCSCANVSFCLCVPACPCPCPCPCVCTGLKKTSFEYASMLMRPEYRPQIAEAYKKKIESIVRKPAKTEEVSASSSAPSSASSDPTMRLCSRGTCAHARLCAPVHVRVRTCARASHGHSAVLGSERIAATHTRSYAHPHTYAHARTPGRGCFAVSVLWYQGAQLAAGLPLV